jgi:pimeloyl-ACP methyl ester carboxylesterase
MIRTRSRPFRDGVDNRYGSWPIDSADGPMLLMTGEMDNFPFADICSATETLAQHVGTGRQPLGPQVTLPDTGHSIHDERPQQLFNQIDAFMKQPGPFS